MGSEPVFPLAVITAGFPSGQTQAAFTEKNIDRDDFFALGAGV